VTPSERNAQILKYFGLVKSIASRMARRYPANVELDDLVNVGTLGLIDAVDRFDASRGVPFKPYAEMRIRGAIVDWLRSEDFVPRPTRDKQHLYERTHLKLLQHLGREPTREEMASSLEMTLEAYDHFRNRANVGKLVSGSARETDQGSSPLDAIPAEEELPDTIWEEEETRARVVQTVRRLPERESQVVFRYDIQGASLKDIGDELGITESRVCQIRSQAHKKLKVWLRDVLTGE
jgi:RNA polymerase sigma factor for flagellar operon FliA